MPKSLTILSTLLFTFSVNAQDWCKYKPAKLDNPPSTFENKLISDRFNHTINPDILLYRETQIETAVMLKPEIYGNDTWLDNDTLSVYSIYNSTTLKHAFRNKLELQVSITDLIMKASEEIRDYNKENLNTGVSIGAKYLFHYSGKKNTRLGIFGQITIPKSKNILNTLFSPELRFLVSRQITKHTLLTGNLGGVYINNSEQAALIYALNIKRNIGRRFEIFTEFYKDCLKTGPARNPNKRWLLGFGYYFMEDLYGYSSFEGGWEHEDSLNGGRLDIGLTYRIK